MRLSEDTWKTRIDGKWWVWLMGFEGFHETHEPYLTVEFAVHGRVLPRVEMPLFQWDVDDPDFDDDMCPLVVRLQTELERRKNDAENPSGV